MVEILWVPPGNLVANGENKPQPNSIEKNGRGDSKKYQIQTEGCVFSRVST